MRRMNDSMTQSLETKIKALKTNSFSTGYSWVRKEHVLALLKQARKDLNDNLPTPWARLMVKEILGGDE